MVFVIREDFAEDFRESVGARFADQIEIGYGLAIADVDGDGKPDIVLADKTTIQWYQNPTWKKHVIAANLTKEDNVCVAAHDIDGDGKIKKVLKGALWLKSPRSRARSGSPPPSVSGRRRRDRFATRPTRSPRCWPRSLRVPRRRSGRA